MRVGFILNHYAPHQVAHVAPVAFALSCERPDWTTDILCSTDAELDFARDISRQYPGHTANFCKLKTPASARLVDPLVSQIAFLRKNAVQLANLKLFATYDALVTPEMTSLQMRRYPAMANVRLIFTGHGAGDGYGGQTGMFDPRIDEFDLVLLPGRRIARELAALGRFRDTPYAIVGYPKLELRSGQRRFFSNDRITVLYNPTQNRAATSWHRFGKDVLDFFYASDAYNLIFAPHVLLFRRAWSRGARLPRRYRSTDTVLIDLCSRASVDMTYLKSADIYLGDLSSQIYEFIDTPRPCVFLDPIGVDYRDNPAFRSWSFGPVVRQAGDLGAALAQTQRTFDAYRPVQEAARDDNFAQDTRPASARGAEVIATYLETAGVNPKWRLA